MNLDMKLKFNFNKRNRYKNICSIEGCNNRACGKYCNKHYHQIKRYGHIKTRTRFDKNEIIINDNVAKILLYDNNCNVIDYTIIDVEDINKISKYKISKCGNYAYANINNKNVALHRIMTNTINELDKIHNPIQSLWDNDMIDSNFSFSRDVLLEQINDKFTERYPEQSARLREETGGYFTLDDLANKINFDLLNTFFNHQHEMTRSSNVNKTTMKNILNDDRDISIAKLVENTSLIIK